MFHLTDALAIDMSDGYCYKILYMAVRPPEPTATVQVNFRVSPEMAAQLRAIAEAEERSISTVLRRLIRERIDRDERKREAA